MVGFEYFFFWSVGVVVVFELNPLFISKNERKEKKNEFYFLIFQFFFSWYYFIRPQKELFVKQKKLVWLPNARKQNVVRLVLTILY